MTAPSRELKDQVLIGEDNHSFRQVLVLGFRWSGFYTVEAADGLTATAVLERSRVDAVVLDLILPGFDDSTVRDEIAANPLTRKLPVIVVRGSEKPVPHVRPSYVLRNPVAPERAVTAVAMCLRESRGATE